MPTPPVPRDAHGLTRKGQRTRERIVEHASRLMHLNGVAVTTIEDVRDAAGVSNSQIYHYFAGKNTLVGAVIAHQTEAIFATQKPLLTRLDSLDGLRAWRDYIVAMQRRLHGRGGCPIGRLASELSEVDDEARLRLADSFARWERALRDGLRAMLAAGQLRPETDPDALALTTLALLQGGLLLTQVQRDIRPVETALDAALTLIASHACPEGVSPAGDRGPDVRAVDHRG